MPKKFEHVVLCRLSKRQRFLYDEYMSRAKWVTLPVHLVKGPATVCTCLVPTASSIRSLSVCKYTCKRGRPGSFHHVQWCQVDKGWTHGEWCPIIIHVVPRLLSCVSNIDLFWCSPVNISVSTPSIAILQDKILPQALPPVYLHFVYLTSSHMLKPFGPPPLFLHTVSEWVIRNWRQEWPENEASYMYMYMYLMEILRGKSSHCSWIGSVPNLSQDKRFSGIRELPQCHQHSHAAQEGNVHFTSIRLF